MSAKKRKFWLIGLVLAAIGIVFARVIFKLYDQNVVKLAIFGFGIVLAIVGLGIIMYGIRKS